MSEKSEEKEVTYKNPIFNACKVSIGKISPLLGDINNLRQKTHDKERELIKLHWGIYKELADEILASDLNLSIEERAFLKIYVKTKGRKVTLLQDLIIRDQPMAGFTVTLDPWKHLRMKSFYIAAGYDVNITSFFKELNKKLEGVISIHAQGPYGEGDKKIITLSLRFISDKRFYP